MFPPCKRAASTGRSGTRRAGYTRKHSRRHDIVYYESRFGKHLVAADQALLDWLHSIDEDSLESEARAYRRRAIAFMSSPLPLLIGKDPIAMVRSWEPRDDCPFSSTEDVVAFFDPGRNGFPN